MQLTSNAFGLCIRLCVHALLFVIILQIAWNLCTAYIFYLMFRIEMACIGLMVHVQTWGFQYIMINGRQLLKMHFNFMLQWIWYWYESFSCTNICLLKNSTNSFCAQGYQMFMNIVCTMGRNDRKNIFCWVIFFLLYFIFSAPIHTLYTMYTLTQKVEYIYFKP